MKKITDYKEISSLIMKYFKRGVLTNNFLTKEDYLAEISEGRLFYENGDEFLCVYVLRDEFCQLYFHALNDKVVLPKTDIPQVCECVGYEDFILKNGFNKLITRTKLEHLVNEDKFLNEAVVSDIKDAEGIFNLMSETFNAVTGYMPTLATIQSECERGLIYKITLNGTLAAVLRLAVAKNSVHIKHLCVAKEFQGQGLGRKMCACALSLDKKCTVWTGSKNHVALNLYKSFGFEECGLRSVVYRKDV